MRCGKMLAGALAALAVAAAADAAFVLQPLASFGGGDGFLAPGDRPYLTTDNNQRGVAYNPVTNHVYVVNRTGGLSIPILDGDTGADLGFLSTTGISGGTFALSAIGVAADGAIYAANLTINTSTSNLKIYRWADESAAPTVAYNGNVPGAVGARFGDDLAVRGAGAGTQLVMGSGSTPAGFNAYSVFTTADGLNFASNYMTIAGPLNGAFRLGIDFGAGDTVFGRQPGDGQFVEGTSFDLATDTAARLAGGPFTPTAAGEALLAVDPANSLLATTDISGGQVRLYDISDLSLGLVLLDTQAFPGTHNTNLNGTGQMDISGTRLYVLETNNGVRAYEIVPEPAALILTAAGALLARRRR